MNRNVSVLHYRNVRINANLDESIEKKPEPPHFEDFAQYKSFLVDGLKAFTSNAASPERQILYEPLTTVSSGYDSAACAALSLEVGCQDAVTVTSARQTGADGASKDDRGTAVAEALGLTVREFDRDGYREVEGHPEAEFVACGDLGQDLPMVAMESAFSQRYVLSGEHGDTMWSRQWDTSKDKKGSRDIVRPSCTGCSLIEYRLRVGFIHLPLPAVGAQSLSDLKRICNSPEMEPWTLHNAYDRPVARRFVEERGVDRSLFGQDKKAITVLLNQDEMLRSLMKDDSYRSFLEFYQARAGERNARQQRHYDRMFAIYRIYLRLFWRINKALSRRGIPLSIPCPIPARYRQPPGAPSFLFHWGIDEIMERYAGSRGL
jgi:hypothetical protein